jgi:glycosyltransferase involved in cell wall biosynthesis
MTTQFGGVAGSTYSMLYLATGLAQKGHKVILGLPQSSILSELATKNGIQTVAVEFKRKFDLVSVVKLSRVVKQNNIDLINAQESKDRWNVILYRFLLNQKIKVVLTRRQRVADNNWFKRYLHVRFSEKIVLVSHGLREIVIRKGFPASHLHVIHNGVPLNQFMLSKSRLDALRNKYPFHSEDIIVGSVSRLKRQDQVVACLKHLPDNVKLLFVGITKTEYLKRYNLSEEQSERVVFAGSIKDKTEALHHYALMHVHVLSSQMDGFGLVSLEAMAMGTPTIGSNYGGITDVIQDGQNGLIFENGDIQGLAKCIKNILYDEQLRLRLIGNGHKTVMNNFSVSKMVDSYEHLFQSIVID